ncbi:class I SAM-dependent DNA methyltransferase [Mariniluteicoccus flavus]
MKDGYFDAMYAAADDPWGFETRWYEERKRAVTLASLPRRRYRAAFEPGCSIGVLSEGLADRCDRLVACDLVESAVERTRARLAGRDVEVRRWSLTDAWPDEAYDLIVLSEVAYYLSGEDLPRVAATAADHLTPDGHLVAVHWRHPVDDYPLTGDEADSLLRQGSELHVIAEHVEDDFRLTVLAHDPRSVAQVEGLA